jgi:ferredoxin--NADP+ reductase
MNDFSSEGIPLTVAVIGAGPSGFYAAEALIKSGLSVQIDMYDRLPSPYGLVRNGVAPDHPKLKQAILLFDKIAEAQQYNFIGNVEVGKDISVEELKAAYHALIFCCGAEVDRRLGIPGEDLPGSYSATEFVGWYNGHPDYRDKVFDLSNETAVIIGQGNVAADICRILAKTIDELQQTDIAQHALDTLANSKVRDIYVMGRRGPAQAKFTSKELKEFGLLENCDPAIDLKELALNEASREELEEKSNAGARKIYELFQNYAKRENSHKPKRCHFQFLRSPVEIFGTEKIDHIVIERNQLSGNPFDQSAHGTGDTYKLKTGILFRSIGYKGLCIPGIPFDESRGIFPNQNGRITDNGNIVPQMYVAGWIKRGPTGIIGTNRACSVETVASLLADLEKLDSTENKPAANAIYPLLNERGVCYIGFSEWKLIDSKEVERGKIQNKPREKYTSINEMLTAAGK